MQLPRFYPIVDTAALAACGFDTVDAAEALVEGGARILQIRHKDAFTRAVYADCERVAALCRETGAMLVIDDRADIARMLNAGVHVGQDDLPPAAARAVTGPHALLGFSTHTEAQLRATAGVPADYVAFGPVFGTTSKRNPDAVTGVEQVRALRPLTARPLVAIGGITRANAREVLAAGADSVAVIGDLTAGCMRVRDLRTRTEEWLQLLAT